MLAELRTPDGEPLDLTLTTNGSLLARKAAALKDAGLQRVTVSLDALDDAMFRRMNDVDFPVADVLRGHRRRASARASARSRSTWSSSAAPTSTRSCRWRATSAARGIVLRFIEYMDVGATNGWRMDEVLPSAEVVRAHRRRIRRSARWSRARPARPPSAGATPTAAARSA